VLFKIRFYQDRTLEAMRTERSNRMPKFFKQRLVVSKKESRDGWYSRGYFPHFDGEGMTQHVTFHLADSLPQHVLNGWREELQLLSAKDAERKRRTRIQDLLDCGYGACFLRDERLAEVVENALLHFDGERYALHAWCVMPNHVHTLFTPEAGFKMSRIAHSWKSFTANQCNRILERTGKFWDREPIDRYIRNEKHFHNALAYIENNPMKANLCKHPEEWRWSSAHRHKKSED
jgi:putative DNA methylase